MKYHRGIIFFLCIGILISQDIGFLYPRATVVALSPVLTTATKYPKRQPPVVLAPRHTTQILVMENYRRSNSNPRPKSNTARVMGSMIRDLRMTRIIKNPAQELQGLLKRRTSYAKMMQKNDQQILKDLEILEGIITALRQEEEKMKTSQGTISQALSRQASLRQILTDPEDPMAHALKQLPFRLCQEQNRKSHYLYYAYTIAQILHDMFGVSDFRNDNNGEITDFDAVLIEGAKEAYKEVKDNPVQFNEGEYLISFRFEYFQTMAALGEKQYEKQYEEALEGEYSPQVIDLFYRQILLLHSATFVGVLEALQQELGNSQQAYGALQKMLYTFHRVAPEEQTACIRQQANCFMASRYDEQEMCAKIERIKTLMWIAWNAYQRSLFFMRKVSLDQIPSKFIITMLMTLASAPPGNGFVPQKAAIKLLRILIEEKMVSTELVRHSSASGSHTGQGGPIITFSRVPVAKESSSDVQGERDALGSQIMFMQKICNGMPYSDILNFCSVAMASSVRAFQVAKALLNCVQVRLVFEPNGQAIHDVLNAYMNSTLPSELYNSLEIFCAFVKQKASGLAAKEEKGNTLSTEEISLLLLYTKYYLKIYHYIQEGEQKRADEIFSQAVGILAQTKYQPQGLEGLVQLYEQFGVNKVRAFSQVLGEEMERYHVSFMNDIRRNVSTFSPTILREIARFYEIHYAAVGKVFQKEYGQAEQEVKALTSSRETLSESELAKKERGEEIKALYRGKIDILKARYLQRLLPLYLCITRGLIQRQLPHLATGTSERIPQEVLHNAILPLLQQGPLEVMGARTIPQLLCNVLTRLFKEEQYREYGIELLKEIIAQNWHVAVFVPVMQYLQFAETSFIFQRQLSMIWEAVQIKANDPTYQIAFSKILLNMGKEYLQMIDFLFCFYRMQPDQALGTGDWVISRAQVGQIELAVPETAIAALEEEFDCVIKTHWDYMVLVLCHKLGWAVLRDESSFCLIKEQTSSLEGLPASLRSYFQESDIPKIMDIIRTAQGAFTLFEALRLTIDQIEQRMQMAQNPVYQEFFQQLQRTYGFWYEVFGRTNDSAAKEKLRQYGYIVQSHSFLNGPLPTASAGQVRTAA